MTAVGSADISRLAEALRKSAEASGMTTHQVLIAAANQILAEMQARVPVRTGNLRDSLGIRVENNKVIIGPDPTQAPYASYVIFDTKPHIIRPRRPGGVLAFKVNGRQIFAKVVQHPGTTAQPFVQDAFAAWVDSLGPMAAEANVQVIRSADGA
jgi:hypothetical protein